MNSFFDKPDWLDIVQKNARKCKRSYIIARAILILQSLLKFALVVMCGIAIIAFLKDVIIPEKFYIAMVAIILNTYLIDWLCERNNQCTPYTEDAKYQDLFEIQGEIENMANATIINIMKQLNPFIDKNSFSIYLMGGQKNIFSVTFRACNQQFPLFIIGDEICGKHLKKYVSGEESNYVLNDELNLDKLRYVCINVQFCSTPEEADKINESLNDEMNKEIRTQLKKSRIFIDYCPIYIIDRNIPDSIMGQSVVEE